jgi:hypothetical protein
MSWTPRSSLQRKLVWIYLPWMLAMVLGGVGWAALAHWFFIEEGRYLIDQRIVLLIAFVLVLVYAFGVLRQRIRLLHLQTNDRENWLWVYHLLAGLGICLSIWLCLGYVETSLGATASLSVVSDGVKVPRTQFYELPSYHLDSHHVAEFQTLSVGSSGRGVRQWDAGYYLAMPILDAARDTTDSICYAWLCKSYHDKFPYQVGYTANSEVRHFNREAKARFMRHARGPLIVFEIETDPDEIGWLESAIASNGHYLPSPHLLLMGKPESVEKHRTKAIIEVLSLWIILGLAALGMVMLPDWNAAAVQRFLERRR